MGQINTNNYPTVDSLSDVDLLIVENATNGTGTTTPKQLRENAIGTTPLQTSAQTVTGAINELKTEIDAGAGVVCYEIATITSGYLGQFSGSANLLLLHLTTDGTADASNGYMMLLSYSRPVARFAYGRLVDADGVAYKQDMYADNTIICKISNSGEGTESDPEQVVILGIINAGFMLTPTAVVSDRDLIDGQGNTLSVLAEALTKTASGNPVVISDCAGGKARSLKTTINAIQDLHGYDKPWVGGADVNKVHLILNSIITRNISGTWSGNIYTYKGCTFTVDADAGTIIKRGTATELCQIYTNDQTLAAGSYKLSGCPSGGGFTSYDIRYSNDYVDTGSGASFSLASDVSNLSLALTIRAGNSDTIVYKPMITLASVVDSDYAHFRPWSNLCPISGRTAVAVDDVGKNVLPNTYTGYTRNGITWTVDNDGIIDADGTATAHEGMTIISQADLQSLLAEYGDLIITGCPTGGGDSTYQIVTSFNGSYAYDRGNGLTLPANGTYSMGLMVQIRNGYTAHHVKFKVMLRPANTSATYVPYAHSSATIQLGTTVYGADINWDTGVATVTHVIGVGTVETIEDSYTNVCYGTLAKPNDSADKGTSIKHDTITNMFEVVNAPASGDGWDSTNNIGKLFCAASANRYWICFPKGKTLSDLQTITADTKICYELATPTTIQLTPTMLELLKGYNRVSVGGGSIELGYIAKIS